MVRRESVRVSGAEEFDSPFRNVTLAKMVNTKSATEFFLVLNDVHPRLWFTMEFEHEGAISFLGVVFTKSGNKLTTKVYRKPTDIGLLLHFQSHVGNRYERVVNTIVDRAYRLSSIKEAFSTECDRLRTMFSKLHYPKDMVDFIIHRFSQEHREWQAPQQDPLVYMTLPFKDQRSPNQQGVK